MLALDILKKRADFLAAARGRRSVHPSMIVQAKRREAESCDVRVGYTCSKKIGGAVTRNRAKRRLREAARRIIPHQGRTGWDYVLIARANATVRLPFDVLESDLSAALSRLHGAVRPLDETTRLQMSNRRDRSGD